MTERLKGQIGTTPPALSCIGSGCPYLVREKGNYYCSHPFDRKKVSDGGNCKSMYDSITGSDAIKTPIPQSP